MKVEDVGRAEALLKLVKEQLAHDIESLNEYIKEKDEIDAYICQFEDDIRTRDGDEKHLEQLEHDHESQEEYINESVRLETYIRQLKGDISIREATIQKLGVMISIEEEVYSYS